jgi:hypothetical protein
MKTYKLIEASLTLNYFKLKLFALKKDFDKGAVHKGRHAILAHFNPLPSEIVTKNQTLLKYEYFFGCTLVGCVL